MEPYTIEYYNLHILYKLLKNLLPIYKSIRLFKLVNPKAIIEQQIIDTFIIQMKAVFIRNSAYLSGSRQWIFGYTKS